MRRHRTALLADEAKQFLADGWTLVLVRGWYWLINGNERPMKVNCNSAKSLIKNGLDEWKVQAWTGDRVFAAQRTQPWPSERAEALNVTAS